MEAFVRRRLENILRDKTLPPSLREKADDILRGQGYQLGVIPSVLVDHDPMDRLKAAVTEVNEAWANIGKPYSLWIDWNHRPRRVVITQGVFIERDILFP